MSAMLDHGGLMDRVYRRQRHVYDATRRYYLLGRDPMLAGLDVPRGGAVLEIGCGTGRNLVQAAELYPQSLLYGVDISRAMLATAGRAVESNRLRGRVRLAHADAAGFDPVRTFGRASFDRIFISYAVSMIPQWRAVMSAAASHLAPGGTLHVVDFGDLDGLPALAKTGLYRWLKTFHVTPRADLFDHAAAIADGMGGTSRAIVLHRGYAWIAIIEKPATHA